MSNPENSPTVNVPSSEPHEVRFGRPARVVKEKDPRKEQRTKLQKSITSNLTALMGGYPRFTDDQISLLRTHLIGGEVDTKTPQFRYAAHFLSRVVDITYTQCLHERNNGFRPRQDFKASEVSLLHGMLGDYFDINKPSQTYAEIMIKRLRPSEQAALTTTKPVEINPDIYDSMLGIVDSTLTKATEGWQQVQTILAARANKVIAYGE